MGIIITKRGQLPEQDPFAGSCNRCKTEISCVRSDGIDVPSKSSDMRDVGHLRVTCPLCGGQILAHPCRDPFPSINQWDR